MTTYAGQWGPEPFTDHRGNAQPHSHVAIYESDGTTLASLYADRGRAVSLANPLPVGVDDGAAGLDVNANGLFWANPGRYVMAVSVSSIEVYRSSFTVNVDPAEQVDSDAATIAAHVAATTTVHGIADTAALETTTGAQTKADAAQASAVAVASALVDDLSGVSDTAAARTALELGSAALQPSSAFTPRPAADGGPGQGLVIDSLSPLVTRWEDIGGASTEVLPTAAWAVLASVYDSVNDRLTDQIGANHARFGSGVGADSGDPKWLQYDPAVGKYIRFPGTAGNALSIASTTALTTTTDFAGEVDLSMDDWTTTGTKTFLAKSNSGGNDRMWRMDIQVTGALSLTTSADGLNTDTATSTVPLGAVDGTRTKVLFTRRASDGRVQFFKTDDGVTYTQIGDDVIGTVGPLHASAAPVTVSGHNSGATQPTQMNFYRARLWSGPVEVVAGALDLSLASLLLDVDPNDASLSAPFSDFTEHSSNQATVTVLRSASGRKTTAVTRTGLLYGTDDYLAVTDNATLDVAAGSSFTLVHAFRFQGNPAADQVLIAKKADLTTAAGYALWLDSSARLNGIIADGTNFTTVQSAALISGSLYVVALVRDVANDQVRVVVNGVDGTPTTDTTTATLANAEELRVGRLSGAGTSYADQFAFAHVLFAYALTADELQTLGDELVLDTSTDFVAVSSTYDQSSRKLLQTSVSGESQPRFKIMADGTQYQGKGTAAPERTFFVANTINGMEDGGAGRIFIGPSAGLNVIKFHNICVGRNAGKNAGGRGITVMGDSAYSAGGVSNEVALFGYGAGQKITTGFFPTGFGAHALDSLVSGMRDSALGNEAGGLCVDGDDNVFLGVYSGYCAGSVLPRYGDGTVEGAAGCVNGNGNVYIGNWNGIWDPLVQPSSTVVIGHRAYAGQDYAIAIGSSWADDDTLTPSDGASARGKGSVAFGTDSTGVSASTSIDDEFKLGTGRTTVYAGKDIKTGQGTLAGAGKWRLGQRVAATIVDGNGNIAVDDAYVEVEIDGTLRKCLVLA